MEQEKLAENLVKAIQTQSQERLINLQVDYESQRQEMIERFRKEAQEEANVFSELALSELRNSLIQNESQSKWKVKKDLFIRRAELVDELFEKVKHDLIDFTKTSDYKAFVKSSLERILSENTALGATILVKASDLKLFEELAEKRVQVEVSDRIHIGGFILKDKAGLIEIDESLDYALKVQREWFTTHSQLDF
jgi:V/A-type H+/Na+-transporting ATPase subunit E